MKSRIKLTRVHQKNGPDYWKADCYILDHYFQTVAQTQKEALTKMFDSIERVVFKDWYQAHSYNTAMDNMRKRHLERQAEIAERANQVKDDHVTVKWSFWNWFK